MELRDATTIRNNLVGLAQRRETGNFCQSVRQLLAAHQHNVALLDELQLLHITVWLTETGEDLWMELLRVGCSPFAYDFNGDTTLHYAIRAANLAYINYLFQKAGEGILDVVNHQLCNLLITCCAETPDEHSTDVLHCLEWLYLMGMSLEAQDSQGKTALMWAAQRGSLPICQWLLSRGAHLAHRDHMNRTALHLACSGGNYELVLYLCERGAVQLMDAESHDDRRINVPFRIAWHRGHLWLALSLRAWAASYRVFGKCSFLTSPYAWAAFLLILWNLICGLAAFFELRRAADLRLQIIGFTFLMTASMAAWLAAAKRDPGSVKPRDAVVPKQAGLCSSSGERDIRVFEKAGGAAGAATKQLRQLEVRAKLVSFQFAQLNKKSHGVLRRDSHSKYEELAQALQDLTDAMGAARPAVAAERQRAAGSAYYVRHVLSLYGAGLAPPKLASGLSVAGVCLTCHHVKSIRQHHCADCGVCVHRFDHHCVWIDNCVGVGNQSVFLLFLAVLSVTQVYYAWLAALYVRVRVSAGGAPPRAPAAALSQSLLALLLSPLFYVQVFNVLVNVLWFAFCVFLLQRTARSMLTDVTFYETIKRGPYIERRFGRYAGPLWDFQALSLADLCQNTAAFLTQSRRRDLVNYGPHNLRNALLHADV